MKPCAPGAEPWRLFMQAVWWLTGLVVAACAAHFFLV